MSETLSLNGVVQRAPALIRDQVADYIRGQITSLKLPPGAMLIEREICEATTASRATVREALRQLEAEGLIVSELRKGTLVASLSRTEAKNIYEIRGQLEGLACRLFAEHADSAQLGALVSTVDRLSRAVDDPSTMLAEKSRFYDVLFDGAGNPELRRILEGLRQRITLLRVNSLAIPGRPVHSLQEIEKIRDAIVARNGELAEELCRQHIRAAADAVLSAPEAHFDESE
ncbi:GntR family transcriptional regulator [Leucobacter soli]|uniref:D-xylose utilization operon transcriptional repressor n=1 Tax=Leucobacter soli TaxID=2812850 RepID=A0A916JY09_9MICO|nr:GntR family transcriptional regulator [Leucobacter soli]CAG7606259.1 putative D-xylose utilization operon transcriptional repressor [Leucobacter soli]